MVDEEKEVELKEDERFCFKCKKVVHKRKFNIHYEICQKCVMNEYSEIDNIDHMKGSFV